MLRTAHLAVQTCLSKASDFGQPSEQHTAGSVPVCSQLRTLAMADRVSQPSLWVHSGSCPSSHESQRKRGDGSNLLCTCLPLSRSYGPSRGCLGRASADKDMH